MGIPSRRVVANANRQRLDEYTQGLYDKLVPRIDAEMRRGDMSYGYVYVGAGELYNMGHDRQRHLCDRLARYISSTGEWEARFDTNDSLSGIRIYPAGKAPKPRLTGAP